MNENNTVISNLIEQINSIITLDVGTYSKDQASDLTMDIDNLYGQDMDHILGELRLLYKYQDQLNNDYGMTVVRHFISIFTIDSGDFPAEPELAAPEAAPKELVQPEPSTIRQLPEQKNFSFSSGQKKQSKHKNYIRVAFLFSIVFIFLVTTNILTYLITNNTSDIVLDNALYRTIKVEDKYYSKAIIIDDVLFVGRTKKGNVYLVIDGISSKIILDTESIEVLKVEK